MDPQQRQAEIFDAVRRLTLRACEVRPQVAVFEDLHWIDQATEDYLSVTADCIPTSRLLQARSQLYFVLSDFQHVRAEGEHLLTLAHQTGDRATEGAALAGMGVASLWAHDFDPALAYSRRAIEVAEEVIDRMKASLQTPGLRISLESSPLIRHVYDLSLPS